MLILRLQQHLRIDHAPSTSRLSRLTSDVPAIDLGLELVEDRLGLDEARLGRLDVGLGHFH